MRLVRLKPYFFIYAFFIGAIPLALLAFYSQQLLSLLNGLILFPILLAVLVFTPMGNIKLGPQDSVPNYSWHEWLARVTFIQLGALILYLSLASTLLFSPTFSFRQLTLTQAFNTLLMQPWFTYYLFPWSLIIFFAIVIGYFVFLGKSKGNIAISLQPLLGRHVAGKIGFSFDLYLNYAVSGTLLITLSFACAQLVSALTDLFGMHYFDELRVQHLFSFTLLTWLFHSQYWQQLTSTLVKRRVNMGAVLGLFTVLIAGLIVFLYFFSQLILMPLPINQLKLPAWHGELLPAFQEQTAWQWLTWGLIIGWIPVLGSHLARIAYGRSIRSIILTFLIVPFFIINLLYVFPHAMIVNFIYHTFANNWVPVLSLIIIVCYFVQAPHLQQMFYGNVTADCVKKYRNPTKYMRLLPITLVCNLIILMFAGYKLFAIMLYSISVPAITVMTMMAISFVILLGKKWWQR